VEADLSVKKPELNFAITPHVPANMIDNAGPIDTIVRARIDREQIAVVVSCGQAAQEQC
jgi:hypothetical protein